MIEPYLRHSRSIDQYDANPGEERNDSQSQKAPFVGQKCLVSTACTYEIILNYWSNRFSPMAPEQMGLACRGASLFIFHEAKVGQRTRPFVLVSSPGSCITLPYETLLAPSSTDWSQF